MSLATTWDASSKKLLTLPAKLLTEKLVGGNV